MSDPAEVGVIVVGGGAAGAAAALTMAAGGLHVQLLVKGQLGDGATRWAQGGLAAVLAPDDSVEAHIADTLTAGAGLSDPAAVAALARAAPDGITWLRALGARFDTAPHGQPRLGREGGHGSRRIVHAGGDATGAELSRALTRALRASSVRIEERTVVLDVLTAADGRVGGVLTAPRDSRGRLGSATVRRARAVVLATGGVGQAFAVTSNPVEATGDGLALALRAGATVTGMEFVQFHPTVLWTNVSAGPRPLITEALRGEGARIVDRAGRRILAGVHPRGDLAPRDVVAAAMHACLSASLAEHLWLDATHLPAETWPRRFPTVWAACQQAGIDPSRQPIPVAPGAHYLCGGIRVGRTGETDVPGLYAIGEVAATGVHGANRLASNSLTEAVLAGRAVGQHLRTDLPRPPGGRLAAGLDLPAVDRRLRASTAAVMTGEVGVSRRADGLARALEHLHATGGPGRPAASFRCLADYEAANLHLVSTAIVTAAQARTESRGCHRRADAPATRARWAVQLYLRMSASGWMLSRQPIAAAA